MWHDVYEEWRSAEKLKTKTFDKVLNIEHENYASKDESERLLFASYDSKKCLW